MNISDLISKAEQLAQTQKFKEAKDFALAILKEDPNHERALNVAAISMLMTGQQKEAIELFCHALRVNPENHEIRTNLCKTLASRQKSTDKAALIQIGQSLLHLMSNIPTLPSITDNTLNDLKFNKVSDLEWLESIFTSIVLPIMLAALKAKHYDFALHLESTTYAHYVKREENRDHFARCFNFWKIAMRDAGRQLASDLLPNKNRVFDSFKPKPQKVPKVAFIIQNESTLAHIEALISFMEGHDQLQHPLIEPIIISAFGKSEDMRVQFEKVNVPVIRLDDLCQGKLMTARYCFIKDYLAQNDFYTAVWITVVPHLSFAFGMRIAPTQIYWSMKYDSFSLPDIDGYLSSMQIEETQDIDGVTWNGGTLCSSKWLDTSLTESAKKIRAQFPYKTLYGTLAREEKLNDPEYLNCIADILEANPQSGYIWTGRIHEPTIQAVFDQRGIAQRCHYIGWVNTKLYCQVLDIFLDSFPCGSGFTLLESMAANKPTVMCRNSDVTYYPTLVKLIDNYLPNGIDTALFYQAATQSTEEYKNKAIEFGMNVDLAKSSGNLNKQLNTELFANIERYATIYIKHILEITQQATSV